jgi:endoglucanase
MVRAIILRATIVSNDDSLVYLGWTGWSAGAFATNYTLSMVPTQNGGSWTDTQIVSQALVPAFKS